MGGGAASSSLSESGDSWRATVAFLLFTLQKEKKLMSSRSVLLTTTLSISW